MRRYADRQSPGSYHQPPPRNTRVEPDNGLVSLAQILSHESLNTTARRNQQQLAETAEQGPTMKELGRRRVRASRINVGLMPLTARMLLDLQKLHLVVDSVFDFCHRFPGEDNKKSLLASSLLIVSQRSVLNCFSTNSITSATCS